MTVDDIAERVEAIERMCDDPERAHRLEDLLYADVLNAIASGARDPAALAVAAIKARSLGFDRWYG